MTTFSKIEKRVKEQYHCWIIGKSLCVNLCASWQGRLANMPNLYSHSRKLPTSLLAPKSKRHRPPNLESQTPNMITFSKIEETPPSESREPDPQHDCFIKNRRGIVLRISRARSPIGLLVRKRQHFPNFKSRISLDKAVCNLHTQHPLSRYHRPFFQSALTELKHVKLAAPTTVL
ncbi:hypothetical protein FF2_035874 [Malus domestica]